jgi:hypothetical protein
MTFHDDDGHHLLAPLALDEPRTPAAVDVEAAIRTGQRRHRAHGFAVAGTVAAVAAVLVAVPVAIDATRHPGTPTPDRSTTSAFDPGAAHRALPKPTKIPAFPLSMSATPRAALATPPATCVARVLPATHGFTAAVVTDGDPSGKYLAGYQYADVGDGGLGQYGVLWTDGKLTTLKESGTDESVSVNSHGVVVGSGVDVEHGKSVQVAWEYVNGKVTTLHSSLGSYKVADINDSGQILAVPVPTVIDGPTPAPATPAAPVVIDGRSVRKLASVDGDGQMFEGSIDEDGTVVGMVAQTGRAYVWSPDGRVRELTGAGTGMDVQSIHDGWVTGGSGNGNPDEPGLYTAERWDLRNAAGSVVSNFSTGMNAAINSSGWIVGMSGPKPAVYWGAHVTVLPQPPGGNGDAGSNATSISDDGHVIGGQTNLGNKVVPVEWRCH